MKLSIITVNFNNRDGLQRTIDSVVCQTWRDFEWIIIDGGSTDGSKELIEQYQDNFAYWCSEPDKGIYNAMNKGIDKARGEYVNFMNSGDCFYEADTLEKVFSKDWNEDILYGDAVEEGQNKTKYRKDLLLQLYEHTLCHQATFIKRELFSKHSYDESLKIVADWKFFVQSIVCENASAVYVVQIIANYEKNTTALLNSSYYNERTRVLQELFPPFVLYAFESLLKIDYNRPVLRTRLLIEHGGIAAFLTKMILKLLDKTFLRINFSKNGTS